MTLVVASVACESVDVAECPGALVRQGDVSYCVLSREPGDVVVCPRGLRHPVELASAVVCASEPTDPGDLPLEVCLRIAGGCVLLAPDASPDDASVDAGVVPDASERDTGLLDSGALVWCWGSNASGQAGSIPAGGMLDGARRVETLCGVAAITAGQLHTCALDPYGAVWCWGANHLGQLGDETMRVSAAPRRVSGLP